MSEWDCEADVLTYNVMIKLCARVDRKELIVFVLERIIEKGIKVCMTTMHSLVAAYVGFGDLRTAERIVQAMREKSRDLCKVLRECNCEDLKEKEEEEAEVDEDAFENDEVSGYTARDEVSEEVFEDVFKKLLPNSVAPSDKPPLLPKIKISYTTLMKAFAMSGQPKLANRVFDEMMRDPRVKVDLIAWNMLVEGYCRLGLIEDAKRVVSSMKENGFYPNVATYGSLANGVSLARKPGEALLLWKEIKERSEVKKKGESEGDSSPPMLKPNKGLLDMLADICVRAAFFKKALEIIACMEENGIPPNKTKYKKIYVEMHLRMFTSKHASQARVERLVERKRALKLSSFGLVCLVLTMEVNGS